MRKQLISGIAVTAIIAGVCLLPARSKSTAAVAEGQALAHNVFFGLKDSSADAKKKFVEACKKHLSKHDGEIFFAVGPIVSGEGDVALTIVFRSKADLKKYDASSRHQQFIKENKALLNFKKLKVVDSLVDLQQSS